MAALGTVEVESMVLSVDGRHQIQLTFTVPLNQALMAYTLQDVVRQKQGKPLKITISEIKKKRTLSQNAYAWVLMHRLAENQRSTAEEIYQVRPWGREKNSIHLNQWPDKNLFEESSIDSQLYDYISEVTSYIRKAKTEANVSQKTEVKKVEISAPKEILNKIMQGIKDIENVGSLLDSSLTLTEAKELSVSNIVLNIEQSGIANF